MILRRISGPKRDENGEWRWLYNEQLHSLYRSPNIVRVTKSRRLRWAGHVVSWRKEDRSALKIVQERELYGGLGVDRSTTLEWTLKKQVSIRGIGLILLNNINNNNNNRECLPPFVHVEFCGTFSKSKIDLSINHWQKFYSFIKLAHYNELLLQQVNT